jgi:hypothetical protein
MAYKFKVNQESLKQSFAVYVVLAKGQKDTKIYVGKTGDNRDGCNPVISRCGNHFSYNDGHSQVRKNIPNHEDREYTYIFDHFDEYHKDLKKRRQAIDRINEMERWLNVEVQNVIGSTKSYELLNRFKGSAYVTLPERQKRLTFRTNEAKQKISGIIAEMKKELS